MIVPIRHDTHTAVAVASVPKFVRCAQCGSEWAYLLVRAGRGSMQTIWGFKGDSARLIAKGRARQALADLLRNECDVIPCPDCGALQPEMQAKYRWHLFTRLMMWTVGILVLIALAYPAIRKSIPAHHTAWIAMWVALGAAWVLAVLWVWFHDVNGNAISRSESQAGPNRLALRGAEYAQLLTVKPTS
jgi:hypothetical protein